jgi:hypothetical protein
VLLRTSIALAVEPSESGLVVLRCGVPARCSGSADTPRPYRLREGKSRLREGSVPLPRRARAAVRPVNAAVTSHKPPERMGEPGKMGAFGK